jgi:hypothetical protein
MKNLSLTFGALLAGLGLAGAGCFQTVTVPHIAESLGPADSKGAPSQQQGFGTLPHIPWPTDMAGTGVTNIKTELPSLQPTVTVLRIPSGSLKLTEFQNLTQAIGLPAGLVGDQTRNLGYTLNWTNQEGLLWQLYSYDRKLTFTNPPAKPSVGIYPNWLGETRLTDSVTLFLKQHGIGERTWRNVQIIPRWQAWLAQLDKLGGCVPNDVKKTIDNLLTSQDPFHGPLPALPSEVGKDCVKAFPTAIPVSFERLIDGANIVDKDGLPEYGGQIMVNATSGAMISGWLALTADPQRSDYAAISKKDMQILMENGGLGETLTGLNEVTASSFALVRLPKPNAYDDEYLVPAVVGEAQRTTEWGMSPFRIVVPLVKQ